MNSPQPNLQRLQAAAQRNPGAPRIQSLEELADESQPDVEPTDQEIIDGFIENFGGTRAQAVSRLRRFDFNAFPMDQS